VTGVLSQKVGFFVVVHRIPEKGPHLVGEFVSCDIFLCGKNVLSWCVAKLGTKCARAKKLKKTWGSMIGEKG